MIHDQQAELAVVFALSIEAGCFVDRLSRLRVIRGDGFAVRLGTLQNREVVVLESGPAAANAAKATHALIDAHRPRLVVSAGFAGGLDEKMRRHDLLVPTSIVDKESHEAVVDPSVLPGWLDTWKNLHRGRLLTLDRVVRLASEKRQLGSRYDAPAVDMESLAVIQVCRERETPCFVVRAISDAVDDELPPDIGRLLSRKSFAGQLGAAVGSVFRRPAAVKDLFQLHQNALAASARLADFLVEVIRKRNIDA